MQMMKTQKSIVYPKVFVKDVLKAFWKGIKPHKWRLFLLVFSIVIGNIFAVVIPLYYKKFFDIVSQPGDRAEIAQELLAIIIFIAFFNGLWWLCYRIATLSNNSYQAFTIARLKQQAYDYLMGHSYDFFVNNFTGSLVQKINRFARSFEKLSDRFIWDLLPLLVRITAVFIVVLFVNMWIALVILLWAVLFISFNIVFSRWKLKYDIKAAEIDSKTTAYLADTIAGQSTIQLFNKFKKESQGYKEITDEQAKIIRLTFNLDGIVEAVQSFLVFGMEFLLLFFAIKYWEQGLITVGVFVMLQAYLLSVINYLWGVTRIVREIYQSYADARGMVEIMILPHEIKDVPKAKKLQLSQGKIEFQNVHFFFNETRKVLTNINLIIKPGEKIALVGPSGAGKSTFVKLLFRFYVPAAGKILIDGQDIAKVTQESLRESIAMVPQDPILFHRTLAENIKYGKENASDKEVITAARLAHCDEFVKNLPQGLQTYVGERGIKLSGGERQRVAIARAILKNSPIFILDEATSSLDSHSEALIQDALGNLMKNRTTIVIAHRLSTVQKMDRIVVIDEGKIVEEGNHFELLSRKNTLYHKLWNLQVSGFFTEEEDEEKDEKYNLDTEISKNQID